MKRYQTARFGELVYDEGDVITLPEGLIGLPTLRRWLLMDMAGADPMKWLQSLDRPDFGFPVLEPGFYLDSYEVEPSAGDLAVLGGRPGQEAVVLVVTTVHPGGGRVTGNLMAPLLLHPETRRGRQVALEAPDLSARQELDYCKFGLAVQQAAAENEAGTAAAGPPAAAPERTSREPSEETVEIGI